jgi:hypothetical protein
LDRTGLRVWEPNYRALGDPADDGIVWFWIGGHDEYMRLVYRA